MRLGRVTAASLVVACLSAAIVASQPNEGENPPLAHGTTVLVRASSETSEAEEAGGWNAGFFVTPVGHVLTTYGAVSGRTPVRSEAELGSPDVATFQVEVFWGVPGDKGNVRPLAASVVAANPRLNLALVATTTGQDVPYVPLGDSDALERAQTITAIGYPWAARTREGLIVQAPEQRSGRVRAFPGDGRETAESGFVIQTEAARHISSRGGPIVDEDGYAVGIVQKGTPPEEAGTGIPINAAKGFLEQSGLGAFLPPRLTLSAREDYDFKGLRLVVAGAVRDRWPGRTRWESTPDSNGIALRIDRVYSSLGLGEIEARLLSGQELGAFPSIRRGSAGEGARDIPISRARVFGSASGWVGDELYGVEYGLFNAETERLVAYYTGPADVIAYNRSLLRQSLKETEITRLLVLPVASSISVALDSSRLPGPKDAPMVRLPEGWIHTPLSEYVPAGLPAPDAALSASPKEDFTLSVRAFWWRRAPLTPDAAARAAGTVRGADNLTAYLSMDTLLGVSWASSGRFVSRGAGLILLEVRAPREKAQFLVDVHEEFIGQPIS